jgi:hypothetical protein
MNYFDNIKSLIIEGKEYPIRTDYRDILTIIEAFEDKELTRYEKFDVMIDILYIEKPPLIKETFEKAIYFLDVNIDALVYNKKVNYNSNQNNNNNYRLYSFIKDWQMIASAMNKYFGFSIREKDYIHWFDFIGAFNDLGECTFTHIIDIRKRKRENKLTKEERQYYYKNREWIDLDYEEIDYEELLNTLNENLERG